MKKMMIVAIICMLCVTMVFAFEQPTFVGLQGRVTDSAGVPVNNGNLRATVSSSPSCESNIIYDYTYTGAVRAGLFSVLLGNDSNLNLTYNRDYYLCTYINGEVQRNLGGSNTTKFRGGQGIIGAGNLTNGTFTTGNYTFADNLTLGGWLFVKNDEDFLSRVLRAPIRYKDLVDRSADENVTGNWTISSGSTIGGTQAGLIGAGEWELVSWTNFTTRIDGSMRIGNIPPANEYKLEFIIWHDPHRTDNNFTELNVPRGIGMRFNNISSSTYKNLKMSQTGAFSTAIDKEFNLSSSPNLQSLYIQGTIYIKQVGDKNITIDREGFFLQFNGTQTGVYSGMLDGSGKLSDIQFFGTPTASAPGATDGGEINGTILLYRHKFFKNY